VLEAVITVEQVAKIIYMWHQTIINVIELFYEPLRMESLEAEKVHQEVLKILTILKLWTLR
jgi:hypothetical protein